MLPYETENDQYRVILEIVRTKKKCFLREFRRKHESLQERNDIRQFHRVLHKPDPGRGGHEYQILVRGQGEAAGPARPLNW